MSEKILNDNELNQVVGGSGSGYPMELNTWYKCDELYTAVNLKSGYYYFCKSDAGNGNFVFEEYKLDTGLYHNMRDLRYVRDIELSPAEYAELQYADDPRR